MNWGNLKKLVVLILLSPLCFASEKRSLKKWWVSVAVVSTAVVFDTASSYGGYEMNPVLGRGRFGARKATIRIGIAAGGLLVQGVCVKKKKSAAVQAMWMNYAMAGLIAPVAVRNYTQRSDAQLDERFPHLKGAL